MIVDLCWDIRLFDMMNIDNGLWLDIWDGLDELYGYGVSVGCLW